MASQYYLATLDLGSQNKNMPPTNSQCVGWVFTLNNYTDSDQEHLRDLAEKDDSPFRYIVFGREVGEEGTPHLQGYLELKKKRRLAATKSLLGERYHLEQRRGRAQEAADYCKKDGDFEEFGTIVGQGKRTDLDAVVEDLKAGKNVQQIAEEHGTCFIRHSRGIEKMALLYLPRYQHADVRGIWFFGVSGTGKSHMARQLWPHAYIKSQNKWFDGYAGEDTIILDDLDEGGKCLSHHLKIWADKYPCTGETKGGTVSLIHHRFVVTSNYTPAELFKDQDQVTIDAINRRFRVFTFTHEFVPPVTGTAGPGRFERTVTPSLSTLDN